MKKTDEFAKAKPIGDRLLLEIEVKEQTIGGIIIPDSVKTGDHKIAKVVSTGDGVYTQQGVKVPMTVKVGDRVLLPLGEMAIQKIKLGDKEYYMCREMDLLLVIR